MFASVLVLAKDADSEAFLGDINTAVIFGVHQETFLAFGCVDDGYPLADCETDVVIQRRGTEAGGLFD